jgi:hypothetical protein
MVNPPQYGGGCKLMPKGSASGVRSVFQVQRSKLKIGYKPYLNLMKP